MSSNHFLHLRPSTIAAFLTLVSFSVKSYQTINNYLSALRRLHVFSHFDTTAFDDIHVKLTQKGLEKSMVHVPHRKAPLSASILLQFRAHLNLCDSAHLALWSAFLIILSSPQGLSSHLIKMPKQIHWLVFSRGVRGALRDNYVYEINHI